MTPTAAKLRVTWRRLRVKLWWWAEKRLRTAYNDLVDAETKL